MRTTKSALNDFVEQGRDRQAAGIDADETAAYQSERSRLLTKSLAGAGLVGAGLATFLAAPAFGQSMDFPAEIFFGGPVASGPPPDLIKHAPVQFSREGVGEQVWPLQRARAHGPHTSRIDVEAFDRVQFRTRGEAGDEFESLFFAELRIAIAVAAKMSVMRVTSIYW